MKSGKNGFYCRYVKRVLDIICALLALIVFCWLYAIVAVLVRIKLGSPVIFKQQRPGKNGKIFTLYKFRTMTDERGYDGNLLPDEKRLTGFGKLLRKTSLDELPEAVNILIGNMSVIGPRPQLVRDMVFMTEEQRHRHDVRPGLSGLAQIRGRNAISWEVKLKTDLEYIENISFFLDVKIVILTVIKALERDGITEDGEATAKDFGDHLLENNLISRTDFDIKQMEAEALLSGKAIEKDRVGV